LRILSSYSLLNISLLFAALFATHGKEGSY